MQHVRLLSESTLRLRCVTADSQLGKMEAQSERTHQQRSSATTRDNDDRKEHQEETTAMPCVQNPELHGLKETAFQSTKRPLAQCEYVGMQHGRV